MIGSHRNITKARKKREMLLNMVEDHTTGQINRKLHRVLQNINNSKGRLGLIFEVRH
jgi:hypothetical protein